MSYRAPPCISSLDAHASVSLEKIDRPNRCRRPVVSRENFVNSEWNGKLRCVYVCKCAGFD